MKAARISEYGGPEVIKIEEIGKPVAGNKQVLIEVRASSINPFDDKLMLGYMKEMIPLQFPVTLGGDVSGDVVEVGDGVEDFEVGDKVYGQAATVAGNSGAFAEFAATNSEQIAKMPSNLDYQEAASLPLVGVSALQGLTEHIKLQAGQKLFIHGGGGGIGSIAIQIAKHIGAYVATTASSDQIDLVNELGADEAIDYKAADFTKKLADYDAVFDTVGGDEFAKTFGILKKGSVAVSMIAPPDEAKANALGITAMMQSTQVNTERLDALRELIESGVVKPQIDQVFTLDKIQDAFTAKETGTVSGKIVLKVSNKV